MTYVLVRKGQRRVDVKTEAETSVQPPTAGWGME